MPSLAGEIRDILASHAGQPVDYVALFMFLNTVAGGHYEDRYAEAEIRAAVRELRAAAAIEAWCGDRKLEAEEAEPNPDRGEPACHYRLAV